MLWVIGVWVVWLVLSLVKFFLWIIGAGLFILWWKQGMLLYIPLIRDKGEEQERGNSFNAPGQRSPESLRIPFKEMWVTTADGVSVHAWLLLQADSSNKPTMMWFHGNAGNIGNRLPYTTMIYLATGCNIMMVDYRGYGNSEGEPSEYGLTLDGQACLDELRKRPDIHPDRIFLLGQSLGGAVAVRLAYNNPDKIAGLLIENTFASIDDMAPELFQKVFQNGGIDIKPFRKALAALRVFLYFFLTSHWRSVSSAKHIAVPVLMFSGQKDEIVPPAHMATLWEAMLKSPNKKEVEMHRISEGRHNETFISVIQQTYMADAGKQYMVHDAEELLEAGRALQRFIQKHSLGTAAVTPTRAAQ